jgi:hypothetical protein
MASLCGNMSTVGKLVLIFVMMLGKLRGLPTHSDAVSDFSFKELKFWVRKAKKEKKEAEGADVRAHIASTSGCFVEFQKQRLRDGQLQKTLKTMHSHNVDERLNTIQSCIQVHISISFSQSSAFVISTSDLQLTIEHDQRDANAFLLERSESTETERDHPKGLSKVYNRKSFDLSRRSMDAFASLFTPTPPTPPASPSRGLVKARTWPARAKRY